VNELRLKQYRLNAKLSQKDVSEMLDITQAYYWKWEKGKSYPNAKQILQLCDVFKCTPNDLFGFYGDYKVMMNKLDEE
jgi:transcriptional regulator with XRE-family HTH domain